MTLTDLELFRLRCDPADDPARSCTDLHLSFFLAAHVCHFTGVMKVEEVNDGPGETTLGEAELAG